MSDHNYPDHFYADALDKVRAVTGKPTGAYDGRGAGSPPYKPGHGYVADPVTKPAHYQRAGIETIDYIRATLDGPGFEAYCIGNVLKYVSRYREKGGIEDLRKAKVYLGWAIQPLGGMRTDQPEGCNPGAIREAKIAYAVASDHQVESREQKIWRYVASGVSPETAARLVDAKPGEVVSMTALEVARASLTHQHPAGIGDVPHERVPKWSPEWAKDLSDYGTAITRCAYRDGALVAEHVPLDSVRLHPMNAEAIRDHDERLSGAEDRL